MSMGTSLFATTSAASAPLSFVLLAHGFDHFTTGLKSAMTGRQQTSLTSQTLQSVGFSENVANFVDNSVFVLAPTAALWTQRAAYTVPCFANSFSPSSHLAMVKPVLQAPSQGFKITNKTEKSHLHKIGNAVKSIENFLGGKGKIITNRDGDIILMRGNKKIRFDVKDPHGCKPHFHLEKQQPNGKWIDATSNHRYYFIGE